MILFYQPKTTSASAFLLTKLITVNFVRTNVRPPQFPPHFISVKEPILWPRAYQKSEVQTIVLDSFSVRTQNRHSASCNDDRGRQLYGQVAFVWNSILKHSSVVIVEELDIRTICVAFEEELDTRTICVVFVEEFHIRTICVALLEQFDIRTIVRGVCRGIRC